MRILFVSRPPLVPELGAAQVALSLAAGVREAGHEAVAWSPETVAGEGRGGPDAGTRARRLAALLEREGPFDVLDLPAESVTAQIARAGFVVARSVQPETLYRRVEILEGFRRNPFSPHNVLALVRAARGLAALRRGRSLSSLVLCLGSLESAWTKSRYPVLAGRVETYRIAPPPAERAALRTLRETRRPEPIGGPRQYLWIGRWAAHKGVGLLVRFLRDLESGARVTVAGCGRDGERALARLGPASGRVRVVPGFTRGELIGLLREHTAGLFTSRVEGWGLGLQEMLESGLPVFATRAGCVPDLEPWLGSRISSFPPGGGAASSSRGPLDWSGYEARFDWSAITRDYLRCVEARRKTGPQAGPGRSM